MTAFFIVSFLGRFYGGAYIDNYNDASCRFNNKHTVHEIKFGDKKYMLKYLHFQS